MKELVQERIIKTEEQTLSAADAELLTIKRNRQLRFLVIPYLALALVLAYVFVSGPEGVTHVETDDDETNFNIAAPWVCGSMFLLLTGFFLRYYFETAAPLTKDIKRNKKLLVYVNPEKFDMGVFNQYFITSPVFKKQQISVARDDFYMISDTKPLVLELAPHSLEVLRITSDEKEIQFFK